MDTILRRSSSDFTVVSTYRLPNPHIQVLVGEVTPEYSSTEPVMPVGPVSIGKARVVRHAVIYGGNGISEAQKDILAATL